MKSVLLIAAGFAAHHSSAALEMSVDEANKSVELIKEVMEHPTMRSLQENVSPQQALQMIKPCLDNFGETYEFFDCFLGANINLLNNDDQTAQNAASQAASTNLVEKVIVAENVTDMGDMSLDQETCVSMFNEPTIGPNMVCMTIFDSAGLNAFSTASTDGTLVTMNGCELFAGQEGSMNSDTPGSDADSMNEAEVAFKGFKDDCDAVALANSDYTMPEPMLLVGNTASSTSTQGVLATTAASVAATLLAARQ